MSVDDNDLRDAASDPDSRVQVYSGTITAISADGTVTVDVGRGPIPGTLVLSTTYAPGPGDVVQVMMRDASSWLVLGPTRTANATTQQITRSYSVPWNVLPAPSGGGTSGSLPVNATGTGSYRSADGWSQTAPYQGAYSPSRGLYTGCYFYGSTAFASLAGRTATGLTIFLHRHLGTGGTGVGDGGPVPQWLVLHAHPTQPGGPPKLLSAPINVGSLASNATGTFTLPTAWAQQLIDRTAFGIGHYATSAGPYSRCKTIGEDSATGQLTLTWGN